MKTFCQMPTSQTHLVCAVLKADTLVLVLVSWARWGEEFMGFHMNHCGPLGVNLSTSNHEIKLGKNCSLASRQGLICLRQSCSGKGHSSGAKWAIRRGVWFRA